jgi:multisubunit Na+/H+ antiporter MnhE subunit
MKRVGAALSLTGLFLRDVVLGGWATMGVILAPKPARSGLVRVAYGDLPEPAALLLGALVSLTPGATTVDIDPDRREFLLHLLDLDQEDAVRRAVLEEFARPLAILFGRRP